MSSTFEDAQKRLKDLAKQIDLHKEVLERLMQPKQAIIVSIPVRMDNGFLKVFTGYRVQYDTSRGPAKGGIRFHPDVDLDEVKSLSFWMAIKCAAIGIPYGGGKGGITVDPKKLSRMELERLSRGYIRAIADTIGVDKDIPAPDVNTNSTIMGWMVDEYNQIVRHQEPGVITGKPLSLGGSKGRDTATAQGGLHVLNLWCERKKIDPKKTTVAIQGFGNAGSFFAKLAAAEGYKIVAVSDSKGGIYNPSGLDVEEIMQHKAQKKNLDDIYPKGSVTDEKGIKHVTNAELLELGVDVLVPAALENQITKTNAANIKAKYILELANGPVTSEADKMLEDKGIVVIPDVLANAGGVGVSYFEWLQNRAGEYWTAEFVAEKLKTLMYREAASCFDIADKHKRSLRLAVYQQALMRIQEAMAAHGTEEYYRG